MTDAKTSIRVRFAPSPTGSLHVGGARTALFNFLFARHTGGAFLLRIEDTDVTRSDQQLTEQILRSMEWLGLAWDEDPVHQSDRRERHTEVCDHLFDNGWAYPCFCSAEELQAKREQSVKETGEYRYDRVCRSIPTDEARSRIVAGDPHTFRFRVPEGEVQFEDAVRGSVTVQTQEIGDFIIRRTDGSPIYQIAVVVDDHDMGITHVIRGDDHLSNTPKQILIFKAMDWTLPEFAHVPMILGSDKKRLSKRHGATSVEEYHNGGYLSEVVVNFLALLGWSPGDDREIMSMSDIIEAFTLDRISKTPSVFDETKLEWMNAQYIMQKSESELLDALTPYLIEAQLIDEAYIDKHRKYLCACIGLMHERMKTLPEFVQNARYFFEDPTAYEEKAVKKHWMKEGVGERIQSLIEVLEAITDWRAEAMDAPIRTLSEKLEVGLGKLLQPARLAVTGSAASPGMFELMEVLGKEITIRRLNAAISYLDRL